MKKRQKCRRIFLGLLGMLLLLPQTALAAPDWQSAYAHSSSLIFNQFNSNHDIPNLKPLPEPSRLNSEIEDQDLSDSDLEDLAKSDYRYTFFGQEVRVAAGTTYYASADLAGSGPHAVFNSDNPYTFGQRFFIGGFALIAGDDQLQEYECYPESQIDERQPAPQFCTQVTLDQNVWLHLYTDPKDNDSSLGWIPASAAEPVTHEIGATCPDSVAVPDIAESVEELSQDGNVVALFLDASGSVSDYSAEIASYASQIDQAKEVIIFAESAKAINSADYDDEISNVGAGTDIYAALNSLSEIAFDEVIVVTDTYHNELHSILNPRDNVKHLTVISLVEPSFVQEDVLGVIRQQWGIEPQIKYLLHP